MNLKDEAIKLLTYLERRKLTGDEACTVMGVALQGLIADQAAMDLFVRILTQKEYDHV